MRDDFVKRRRNSMRDLTGRVATGDLSAGEWLRKMRGQVKQTFTANYAFGRGGTNAMTAADRKKVGRMVRDNGAYLQRFAEELAAGKLSAAQAQARAEMYAAASTTAHAQGQAAAWGITLPVQPGISTACKANCQCGWEIEQDDDEIRAYWRLHSAESCETCLERADAYNPFRIAKAREEAA